MRLNVPPLKGLHYLLCMTLCGSTYALVNSLSTPWLGALIWLIAMGLSIKWTALEQYEEDD